MLGQGDAVWFASLREVRRQAKYIADATGVGSQVEGKTRLYKDLEQDWEVVGDNRDIVKEDGVWQEQQWLNAFECLFWETPLALQGGPQQDDLMYYVVREHDQEGNQELLIRRKGKSIPADLTAREQVERISWVDTVLLNLVLQIAFRLSVTISRRPDVSGLEGHHRRYGDKSETVSGEVFASPYRLQVQGSQRQAGRETMVLAYPHICFTVDGSHTGFDSLVLDQPGYCLHVRLTACQGIGMHAKAETLGGPLSEPRNLEQPEPVELLSGFVSLEQMADAIERSQRSLVIFRKQSEALLSLKGPGGQGRALVSAKWVACSDEGHLFGKSLGATRANVPIAGPMWRQLKRVASVVGKDTQATSQTVLQCAMLEVCLPVTLTACLILGVPLSAAAEG